MIDDESSFVDSVVDPARTAHLCDVGGSGYLAATAVSPDGTSHLVLARLDLLGKEASYEPACPEALHEHEGQLPLDFVRKIAIAQRRRR